MPDRRTFLKGLAALVGAAAGAPKVLPELLQPPAPTVPEPSTYKTAMPVPISDELFEDFEPVENIIQRELHWKWVSSRFQEKSAT